MYRNFEKDFPSDVYDVLDARFSRSQKLGFENGTSNFYLFSQMQNLQENQDPHSIEIDLTRVANTKTLVNRNNTNRIDVYHSEKKVKGFTNVYSELIITWAKMSNDFNKIPYKDKTDVILLAKMNIAENLTMLRAQVNADQGVSFNDSVFKDVISKGQDILKNWQESTYRPVILR